MKLFGVLKIRNGTEKAQATAVFEILEKWNFTERINFVSFNTTANNTGVNTSASVLVEKKINKNFFSLLQ